MLYLNVNANARGSLLMYGYLLHASKYVLFLSIIHKYALVPLFLPVVIHIITPKISLHMGLQKIKIKQFSRIMSGFLLLHRRT